MSCPQIVNFDKPAKIHPQTTVAPFHVSFHANGSDLAFSTILKVYTNASIFTIPIHCYDGKLKVSRQKCCFPLAEEQNKQKNFSRGAGSLGASVRGGQRARGAGLAVFLVAIVVTHVKDQISFFFLITGFESQWGWLFPRLLCLVVGYVIVAE